MRRNPSPKTAMKPQLIPLVATALLAPAIAKVIADAGASQHDLTGIVAGVGPGPFTGLRVGLVTARVLGDALSIPVYGLCTLDVIAADVDAGEPGAPKRVTP